MRSEKQKSYAELRDMKPPTRTSKLLTPTVVTTIVALLATCSIIGVLIAVSIFSSSQPYARYIGVTQAFTSMAVSYKSIH